MQKIYAIYDKKMGQYKTPPMFVEHIVEVERNLITVMENPKSNLAKFPTDYELYNMGTFEQLTGLIEVHEKPVFEANLSEYFKEVPKNPPSDNGEPFPQHRKETK